MNYFSVLRVYSADDWLFFETQCKHSKQSTRQTDWIPSKSVLPVATEPYSTWKNGWRWGSFFMLIIFFPSLVTWGVDFRERINWITRRTRRSCGENVESELCSTFSLVFVRLNSEDFVVEENLRWFLMGQLKQCCGFRILDLMNNMKSGFGLNFE